MHLLSTLLLPLAASAAIVQRQGSQKGGNKIAAAARTSASSPMTTTADASSPTVTLDYTTLVPVAGNSSIGYYKYQNIRFAAVPTGEARWAVPAWPPVETGINTGSLAAADVDCASTEDCLYMDVWAPANSAGKSLPVLVWTYGGGFTGGSKAENTPEGLFNLTTDFVFVSYNYRLGMTGIANGPTLLHEGGISNTGVYDVQQAFAWTKKYISAFGGDADRITAMGFSAGASQVLFQTTRFGGHAEQNFAQAYVTSPGFVPGAGHYTAEMFWQNVSTAVGCDGGHIDCMRAVDFTTLQDAASTVTSDYTYQFQPRVDGDIIADTYEAQLYQGRFNFSGPMVITHEQHEANSQSYSGVDTTDDVAAYLRIFFPAIEDSVVQKILDFYPESDYTSPGLRFADMKQHFDLTAHNLAATHAMNNQTWNALCALGSATHGTDQSYYWYKTASVTSTSSDSSNTTTTSSAAVSHIFSANLSLTHSSQIKMQKYLLSFVLTGNPNTLWPEDKLEWPLYNSTSEGIQMVFNETFYTDADDLAIEKVVYWNKALWY
ncbi:esterase [Cadophora sp. DSE1049]|nr:esterase [Cadophora sp. DSE1049]